MRRQQRVHAGPNLQFARALEPDRPVRRGHDHAAGGEMAAHQLGQPRLRRRVERRGRLVEQPDRPLDRDQPRDRQPPPLPGRQIGRRQVGERGELDRRQRGRRRRRRPPEILGPELQVFGDRQRRLQRVLVAEIMRLLGDACASASPPVEREPPAGEPHQPGDHAQQRGFAGAVAAGHQQRLAAVDGEIRGRRTPRGRRGRRPGCRR